MDGAFRFGQRPAHVAAGDGLDLGSDRQRDLLRCLGADVQPGRARDPIERLFLHTVLEELLAPPRLVPARPERADVEGLGVERADERRHVPAVVVREDDHGRGVVGPDLRDRVLGPRDHDLVRARQYLQDALRAQPDLARAYNALGVVEAESGNAEEAIRLWKRAAELNPRAADTLLNLGLMLRKEGRAEEARPFLQAFLRAASPTRDAADVRAVRAWLSGR